ncbi:MAG: methylenetetrahydrofolate--tRNA-(uracil(54)-C(5))-methyltransferase (FADH(2)-oxidizing) TrmFO [Gemmatimonadota bacterium]|nr:methylenetetrahydrofolate--tRNA-(uracil(54)-C(5))-methyltransferase (FADH(2)-oxidizing) TrmFO [Gemmatimonadota bacterium]MDP6801921.1 methylenetetrahydrofolate--tRNA-(uracil(54)-C(5))-methyltransferase (FADH(2)-oxidizing) TrmFO [Gemmatimonadota bacterium]MDP7032342.1 methylenetetrahydrofolate--tRNA-(uracil(54)-C(5))-methyltransferase (FADH(2)-oxidizing) TrmFO [Gemmatimonadota bacterium]
MIGGGLAGSEAALTVARRGHRVELREMRPLRATEVHTTGLFAEVVCSNSFKSALLTRPSGILKEEMRRLNSALLPCAEESRVEAGTALAVDRTAFAETVTRAVEGEARIRTVREEVVELPEAEAVIVATGPLTTGPFADAVMRLAGSDHLHFHDATAPIVQASSLDQSRVFQANRRDQGSGHYLNCPFTREEYEAFVEALLAADAVPLHDFESSGFFENCMPVDDLARRGLATLRFGPMRAVGLTDPSTGRWPYAVVQLRPENREGTAYNLVGFQNRMRHGDQRRILRMIPGLEHAEFLRLGRVHRNTYLDSPRILDNRLRFRSNPSVFLAGQLTGLEGYVEAIATGLLAGMFAADALTGFMREPLPAETALGSILRFATSYDGPAYRPTNANLGLFPPLEDSTVRRRDRGAKVGERALASLDAWLDRCDKVAPHSCRTRAEGM